MLYTILVTDDTSTIQQAWYTGTTSAQRWPSVLDAGSTLNQRWANASRSLEAYWTYLCITSDEPMSCISTCDILFSFPTRCQ